MRFRAALKVQNKTHLLPFRNWTYPVGPYFVIGLNSLLVLVQGWKSFSPQFSAVDFVSYYLEIPLMVVMYFGWKVFKRTRVVSLAEMDLETDTFTIEDNERESDNRNKRAWRRILNWVA